jgi:nicotinamidase-related amidase
MTLSSLPKYTLVVIDMQTNFTTSFNKKNIEACKREIREAASYYLPILLVEFVGCGRTVNELYNEVESYSKMHLVRKNSNGGGTIVPNYIKNNGLYSKHIRVVGVNTEFCVYETTVQMRRYLKSATIEIVSDACNSSYNHNVGIQQLSSLSRVNIV